MSSRAPQQVTLAALIVALVPTWSLAQSAPPASAVTLVRAASGPAGADVGGNFQFTEERRLFSRATDRQVVVWFSWRGTAGNHKLTARWRAPNGASNASEFDYAARNALFGAYWTLPLSSGTPTGNWTIEALVDGVPAGSLDFEITDADVPRANGAGPSPTTPLVPEPTTRFPLSRAEMYERLRASFSYIERPPSPFGQRQDAAAAMLAPGQVVTALAALDLADALRIRTPQGTMQALASVVGWDATAGWAVLARNGDGSGLRAADPATVKVGDPCYAMDGSADGTRVLAECTIAGRNDARGGGNPFVVTFLMGRGLPGSAVVDQYGEVIGLVAIDAGAPLTISDLARTGGERGVPLVALPPQTIAAGEPVALLDLRRRGVLLAPASGEQHIRTAGFTRQGRSSATRDYRDTFSATDRQMFAVITWEPRERIRGNLVLRVYSRSNLLIGESKAKKVDFRPGRDSGTTTEVALAVPASAGSYRAELVLDDTVLWRRVFLVR